jgi:hypothetical protein
MFGINTAGTACCKNHIPTEAGTHAEISMVQFDHPAANTGGLVSDAAVMNGYMAKSRITGHHQSLAVALKRRERLFKMPWSCIEK